MLVTTQWPLKRAATSPHLSGFVFYGCLESLTELSALCPTTPSFSTQHLAPMNWAKTAASRDEKHLNFGLFTNGVEHFPRYTVQSKTYVHAPNMKYISRMTDVNPKYTLVNSYVQEERGETTPIECDYAKYLVLKWNERKNGAKHW